MYGYDDVKYECKEFNDIMDVWLFEYDGDLHLEDATCLYIWNK